MNIRKVYTVQSFRAVSGVLKRKSADYAAIPSVAEDIIILDGLIADYDEQINIIDISTKGYTDTKNAAKAYAVTTGLRPVSTRLIAYAKKKKLQVLLNEVNFTEIALLKKSDTMLVNILHVYSKNARKYLPDMSGQGLTEGMIVALENSTADYEAKLMGTPQYIGQQKAAKQRIDKDVADGNELLTTCIDPVNEIIRDEYPDTYAEFQNARKVKYPPRRTLALKIKAIESGTQLPIQGVYFTIIPDTNGEGMKSAELVKNVKRSTAKGACQEKNMSDGKYLIIAEKPGFGSKNGVVYISSGQTCRITFELTPLQ